LDHLWMLFAALIVDAAVGDPDVIWTRVPHPVSAAGWLIRILDQRLNRPSFAAWAKRSLGIVAVIVLVWIAGAVGYGLERLFRSVRSGAVGTILTAAILLAGRSLRDHVAAVAAAFATGGLAAARI